MEVNTPFKSFVVRQAQKAGFFLGQLPDPNSGEKIVRLPAAIEVIQDLEMLSEKCQGNLEEEEKALLNSAISNLQRLRNGVESTESN